MPRARRPDPSRRSRPRGLARAHRRRRGRGLAFGVALGAALAVLPAGGCSLVMDFGDAPGDYAEVYEPVACVAFVPGTGMIPDQPPSAEHPFGVSFLTAGVVNQCDRPLAGIQFLVTDLRAGYLLLNADGAPEGEGARMTVAPALFGADGVFGPGEQISVTFEVHRGDADPVVIEVQVWGRLPRPPEAPPAGT